MMSEETGVLYWLFLSASECYRREFLPTLAAYPLYKPSGMVPLGEKRQTHISYRNKSYPHFSGRWHHLTPLLLLRLRPLILGGFVVYETWFTWNIGEAMIFDSVPSVAKRNAIKNCYFAEASTHVMFLHYVLYFLIFRRFATRLPCFSQLL